MRRIFWERFKRNPIGLFSLYFLFFLFLCGLYAPVLASGYPFFVMWNGEIFFPFFRYLFFTGYYTKSLDLFFNLWMFTFPFMFVAVLKGKKRLLISALLVQGILFTYLLLVPLKDPTASYSGKALPEYDWKTEIEEASSYKKLNLVLKSYLGDLRYQALLKYTHDPKTLQERVYERETKEIERLRELRDESSIKKANYLKDRFQWIEEEKKHLTRVAMPFFRPFHWEEDVGGSEDLNRSVPWWELSRLNRKDLSSALLFGIRISFVVGIGSTLIALLIAIPIGALAGYWGGLTDLAVCRILEVWEAIPTLFILMMVVSFFSSKSIFLIIMLIGFFGWTGFCRFVRGEFLRQKSLAYVDACRVLGLSNSRIIFTHILPNALTPVLTLLPFAVLGAISSEAGLAFLGLGEEGSASLGALMDEGKTAFPGDSRLLWPPAILLTVLLISIALVGDGVRQALDPRESY